MFKYAFLLLISLTCLASQPKFHYLDCVRINDGFYKGCTGKVTEFYPSSSYKAATYSVSVEECKGQGFFYDFYETELEGCKR